MPPRKREEVTTEVEAPKASPFQFPIEPGRLYNLVVNGQFLPNYELIEVQRDLWVFRGALQASPQTEIVGIPYHAIERIGLVGQR